MDKIQVATWNARALITVTDAQGDTLRIFNRLVDSSDITCVQEVHGNKHILEKLLQRLKTTHWFRFSLFRERLAGGVLTESSSESAPETLKV